jgi:hypothetical protein
MKIPTKLFSLFLVLVLLGVMPLTLCAEGTGSSAATVTATVIANNSPVYSVAVPTGICADDLQRTADSSPKDIPFTIHISEILTLNDRQICVLVSGSEGEYILKNEDGTSTLPYKVYSKANKDKSIEHGGIFATFTEVGSQDGFIQIDQKNITKADTYTGNLRFSFTLMDIDE